MKSYPGRGLLFAVVILVLLFAGWMNAELLVMLIDKRVEAAIERHFQEAAR